MSSVNVEDYSIQDDLGWIRHGDLLLFRAGGWFSSRAIALAGRGKYSHAAMFAWWGKTPLVLEVREWKGGRAVTLASQVKRYPGRIEVFGIRKEFDQPFGSTREKYNRFAAVQAMLSMAGCDYGWHHLWLTAIRHLPVLRWFAKPITEDEARTRPPYCSEGLAIAACRGGQDPVPELANRLTEPNDLARSLLYESSGRLLVP